MFPLEKQVTLIVKRNKLALYRNLSVEICPFVSAYSFYNKNITPLSEVA